MIQLKLINCFFFVVVVLFLTGEREGKEGEERHSTLVSISAQKEEKIFSSPFE
jgi:hypothetical protein